jgi:hypothetical protein
MELLAVGECCAPLSESVRGKETSQREGDVGGGGGGGGVGVGVGVGGVDVVDSVCEPLQMMETTALLQRFQVHSLACLFSLSLSLFLDRSIYLSSNLSLSIDRSKFMLPTSFNPLSFS